MDLFNILDVTLYGLIILDFIYKYLRYHKDIRKLGKAKRYHPAFSKTKIIVYIVILALNLGYLGYRLYMISKGYLDFYKISVLLPIICFYILSDIIFDGIYYSNTGIYVKSNLILFGEVVKSYRHFNEKENGYGYTIYYQPRMSGEIELEFFIKNEKEAFELMNYIPFQNED